MKIAGVGRGKKMRFKYIVGKHFFFNLNRVNKNYNQMNKQKTIKVR